MGIFDLRGPRLYGRMETGVEGVAIAGLVVAAAGTTYGVVASNQQANYQAEVENQNQKTALLAAADAIHRGDIAETAARTRTRLLISKQRAGYAAAGIDLSSGTPVEVTADTAMFGEMDALTIRNDAAREAWGYVAQSEDFKRRAALVKSAARNNAGSSLLTGGSTALNQYSAGINSGVFPG
jgi:hypothetical protein